MEEACTVWEGVLIDQKEESTSTDMPLGTAIHNIEITLGKGGQLARAAGAVAKLIAKEGKSATLKWRTTGIEPAHGGFTIHCLDPLGYIRPVL